MASSSCLETASSRKLRTGDSLTDLKDFCIAGELDAFIASDDALKASRPVLDLFEFYSRLLTRDGCFKTARRLFLQGLDGDLFGLTLLPKSLSLTDFERRSVVPGISDGKA